MTADPNKANEYLGRGRALADQGLFGDAIEQFRLAYELWLKDQSNDRKFALCNWADALREQKLYEQAAEKCGEAIRVDPEYPEAYNGLGRVLAAQERFDDAIEQYRQADELWRKNQSKDRKLALYYWGDALHRQGDYKQAAEKNGEAIKVDSEYADAYVQLGDVRAKQERFDDAIEQYRQADELGQKKQSNERKKALEGWAKALGAQKLYDEAAEKCREAIRVDPDDPSPHIWFGDLLADQKLFDRAIEKYRKADELGRKKEPKDRKSALRQWAEALRVQKRYDEAVEKLRETVGIDLDDPEPYKYFGDRLRDQERYIDAIEQYRQADEKWRKKEPKERTNALLAWTDALRQQKNYDEAAEKCREAIRVDEDEPWAYCYLGYVFAEQKRYVDAIEQYRQADEKWRKKEPKERKNAFWAWADALRQQKNYDEAAEKCREAIRVDENDPLTYYWLGYEFANQELFDKAIEQYRTADDLWQKKESPARKYALWGWGFALLQQEKFDEAIDKFRRAVEIVSRDFGAVHFYGSSLAAFGRYQEAIAQFEKAYSLNQDDPFPHHSKALILFELGRYEEGWKEWRAARQCYERALGGELRGKEHLVKAFAFADVLGYPFECYEGSDKFYKWVLDRQDEDPDAWAGRAILYQRWANSGKATPEIHARSSYLIRRASELLKRELGKGNDFQTFLNLANLYFATCDWAEARERLDRADSVCGGSMLKRAKVTVRRGLICYRLGEHAEAEKHFRQALLVKPGNLTLRSNLGNALLQLKKFNDAKDEFAGVLKLAPENIDALLGAAQVSIELADDSDPDQYQIGVDYLNYAIEYGWHREAGSVCLSNSEAARIYYVRGHARTKSYEADPSRTTLTLALKDFQKCKELDPKDRKAPAAIEKITKFKRRRMRESWLEVWGPLVISVLGAIVLLFVQLDFFFPGKLLPPHSPTDATKCVTGSTTCATSAIASATEYGSLTFGSLLFMIAGLCLPQVLKLKLVGFELDKASVDRVSLPSTLGISSVSLIETLQRRTATF